MIKALTLAALALSSCTPALADMGPKETHVGYVYIEGQFDRSLGEFWNKNVCEFVGKGEVTHALFEITRPYQTTPEQGLRMMTIEVKCWKKNP